MHDVDEGDDEHQAGVLHASHLAKTEQDTLFELFDDANGQSENDQKHDDNNDDDCGDHDNSSD